MNENEPSAENKPVKTYISENNQNKISSTLTLQNNDLAQEPAASQGTQAGQGEASLAESRNKTQETGQAQSELPVPEEPELLNAPTLATETPETDVAARQASLCPPTSATAEAEAAAGLPIGSLSGHKGEGESKE